MDPFRIRNVLTNSVSDFRRQVSVVDRSGVGDEARVFIYLLREDQRVKFVLRMQPQEAREKIDYLRE